MALACIWLFALVVASGTLSPLCMAVTVTTCNETSTLGFAVSPCAGFVACQRAMCRCVGASQTFAAGFACLRMSPPNTTCTMLTACSTQFERCIGVLVAAKHRNFSDACGPWAALQHATALEAVANGYTGSRLQHECHVRRCLVAHSSAAFCSLEDAHVNDTDVCAVAKATAEGSRPLLNATLRVLGTGFAKILNSSQLHASLSTALRTDVALLLQVSSAAVVVTSMELGSLIANFTVFQVTGGGTDTETLLPLLAAGGASANWLVSVQYLYSAATNSTERLGMGALTVRSEDAGAPPPMTPTPQPTGPAVTSTVSPPSGVPALSISLAPPRFPSLAVASMALVVGVVLL